MNPWPTDHRNFHVRLFGLGFSTAIQIHTGIIFLGQELWSKIFYFARISWSDKPDGRGLSSSEKCKLHMKTLESLLVLCETKKSHLLLLWVSVLTLFHKLLQYRAVGAGGVMALQILADQLTLFKPRGQIMPTTIQRNPPPGF